MCIILYDGCPIRVVEVDYRTPMWKVPCSSLAQTGLLFDEKNDLYISCGNPSLCVKKQTSHENKTSKGEES